MSREAVIVSSARTGLAKSGRGGFNMTHGAAMGGHAIKHAIERANIEPGEVEDVIMGWARQKARRAKMLVVCQRFGPVVRSPHRA